MKPLTPSAALAAVVGAAPLPRTEVVSKLWTYIKKHKLQDAANKRNINADDKLKAVFGKAQVSMFEMAGLIGMARGPLTLLTDVEEDQRRVGLEALAQGLDGHLLDAGLSVLDQSQETG
jgi:chromatin remodeling complex protein RSC6